MDADTQLDLVVGEIERGTPGGRHRARCQGQTHGASIVGDALPELGKLRQVIALLRGSTGDLLHQHGDADTPAAGRVERVGHGHVVCSQHRGHLDAFGACQFGGHLEVHHVAGVVLHDVQDTSTTVDGDGGGEDLIRRGRGEDLTAGGGIQHAQTNEAAVHGLVARAAARDQTDLAGARRIGTDDETVFVVDTHGVGVREFDTAQRVSKD